MLFIVPESQPQQSSILRKRSRLAQNLLYAQKPSACSQRNADAIFGNNSPTFAK
jgi:hypothetical protein